jgi:putative SOS response-associated peptidase YedK
MHIEAMKWGMVIPNTTDLVINGRLEELCVKPFFRNLLETKRCVLAVNGYYEWTKQGEPHLISTSEVTCELEDNKIKVTNQPVLLFACLYNNTTKQKD